MSLDQLIREAVASGAQVHVWPEPYGAVEASVRGPHGCRHTRRNGTDAIAVLTAALVEDDRLRRDAARPRPRGAQLDIEDVAAPAELGDLIG